MAMAKAKPTISVIERRLRLAQPGGRAAPPIVHQYVEVGEPLDMVPPHRRDEDRVAWLQLHRQRLRHRIDEARVGGKGPTDNIVFDYNASDALFPIPDREEAKNALFTIQGATRVVFRGNYQAWSQPARDVTKCFSVLDSPDLRAGDNRFIGVAQHVPAEYDDGGNVY